MNKYCGVVVLAILSYQNLEAVSLDGTASIKYEKASYPFANGDFAKGFVWLNGGFSIPAGSFANLNVARVAGPIDLNETGIIALKGDLSLDSKVTLPSGGVIYGRRHTVRMGGDLTIRSGTILQIINHTVIDGQGHALILENGLPGGRLAVNGPSGTTLTLRNMTIRGARLYDNGYLSILFGGSPNQTLILENVTMHLDGTMFFFFGGNLKIKGDVKITGAFPQQFRPTLQPIPFIYFASNDCTIAKDSSLFIDTSVEFVYDPLDLRNDHFKMNHASSRLFLNGCTFFVPQGTGLNLVKGQITVDHMTTFGGNGVIATSQPIQIGIQGAPKNDVAIDMLPGATLRFDGNILNYQNQE